MNRFEERTKEYFLKHGFTLNKLSENETKRPDFEDNLQEILVEIKHYEGEQEVDGPDPSFKAIRGHLEKAARQFQSEDYIQQKIHIIVFFSEEVLSIDIDSVLTGCLYPPNRNLLLKSSSHISKRYIKYIDIIAFFEDTKSQ